MAAGSSRLDQAGQLAAPPCYWRHCRGRARLWLPARSRPGARASVYVCTWRTLRARLPLLRRVHDCRAAEPVLRRRPCVPPACAWARSAHAACAPGPAGHCVGSAAHCCMLCTRSGRARSNCSDSVACTVCLLGCGGRQCFLMSYSTWTGAAHRALPGRACFGGTWSRGLRGCWMESVPRKGERGFCLALHRTIAPYDCAARLQRTIAAQLPLRHARRAKETGSTRWLPATSTARALQFGALAKPGAACLKRARAQAAVVFLWEAGCRRTSPLHCIYLSAAAGALYPRRPPWLPGAVAAQNCGGRCATDPPRATPLFA